MRNRVEKKLISNINASNGHLLPSFSFFLSRLYVNGMACTHCGKVFSRRFADASNHLRKVHHVLWYDSEKATWKE